MEEYLQKELEKALKRIESKSILRGEKKQKKEDLDAEIFALERTIEKIEEKDFENKQRLLKEYNDALEKAKKLLEEINNKE